MCPLTQDRRPFVFGDWTIDPETGEVYRGGQTARLEPRVMEVLLRLVDAEGRVVSKGELFESVWGDVAVTDDVLRRCIYSLRNTFGDDSEQPRYIRTLPRRGYQVVAVVSSASSVDDVSPEVSLAGGSGRGGRRVTLAAAAALAIGVAATFTLRSVATSVSEPGDGVAAAPLLTDGAPSPTTAEELFELAMRFAAQRGSDDLERAIGLFEKVLERDPDHARAHAELANTYALSVRGYFRDTSRLDLSIAHATRALGLDPTLVEANKALGLAFAGKGWLAAAAREYERALKQRPAYQAVINNLAIIEVSRGNLARALRLQQRLDNAVPTRALHLSNLGNTYRLLGDYSSARRFLDASLDFLPDNALATANLAMIDLVEGDVESARHRVRRAARLYPTDAPFLATAGMVELVAGNAAVAEDLFATSAAHSADGTNNRAWLGLAYLHVQRGEHTDAESIFAGFRAYAEESRRLRREHWAPHYNLTAIHAMSGRVDEALRELDKAVSSGFVDIASLEVYPFFHNLRSATRFTEIVSDLRRRIAKMRNEADPTSTS